METDAGAWTLTNGVALTIINNESVSSGSLAQQLVANVNLWQVQLQAAGGNIEGFEVGAGNFQPTLYVVPESLMETAVPGLGGSTWREFIHGYGTNIPGGIHTGALAPGQIQYTTAYDADIVAQAGHTVLTKSMNIDTRNKVIGQSNLNAQTALTFIATADGGNVVGSENLMLDGAGMPTTAANKMLCPFASAGGNVIPAYCNIVQVGSKYDLTIGSVTTAANERFVGTDATAPVVLNYAINVKPYTASGTQVPAIGSAMAYIKAHIQEGNNFNTTKAEDLTYSETSSVNGYINSFNKVIAYQSGKSLL
jgi:hypothetical protein